MTKSQEHEPAAAALENASDRESLRRNILDEISRLRRLAIRGFWALSLFLLISILAWRNFPLAPSPETFAASLGPPPSPQFVSIALLVYIFFAIILSLSRMMTGIEHRSSFCHVGYLTGFYFFYYAARALNENYWAVFSAGITILGLESYRLRTYCHEAIAREMQRLAHLEKTGHLPPDE